MKKCIKKIFSLFHSKSLFNQLFLMIFCLALGVVLVVSPVIDRNINRLVSNQIFEMILNSQSDYLQNFYNPFDKGKDKQVYHIVRSTTSSGISWEAAPPLTLNTTKDLVTNLFEGVVDGQTETTKNYVSEYQGQKIYFTITYIKNMDSYLISFAYSEYSNELLNSIRNELVYVLYGVIIVLAIIMFVWVATMIQPLRSIQRYINKIKQGEKGELDIMRTDEIGQVSHALVEMKKELDRQEQLKEEFMHNISHDLKTPIAVIQSYALSMKDDIYPYGTKEASLDVILENTYRLENKVKSFLYLNRLDYINQEELILDDVNMNELITKVTSQLDVGHQMIEVVVNNEKLIFKGQEEHWRNVIENIIENAKRYYKEKIRITLDEDAISIFNDGPQIDEELIQTIFKPYTKGEKGNFGLGLSIVKKVVAMYGYKIKVENVDGGVQFVIYR